MSPRFRRLRQSRLIRALKWLFTRPFFWAAVAIIIALNWGYGQLVPHIVSIPLVRQGGDLIIDGQHFGAQQGNSYLVFDIDQQQLIIDHAESWSDTRIDVKLPVANTAGTVDVVRRIPLFALASNVVAYVVQTAGLPSQPYCYEIPVQENSPWPIFRRDQRNTVSYRAGGAQRTFHADSTSRPCGPPTAPRQFGCLMLRATHYTGVQHADEGALGNPTPPSILRRSPRDPQDFREWITRPVRSRAALPRHNATSGQSGVIA